MGDNLRNEPTSSSLTDFLSAEYVYLKPVLAAVTLILKANNVYNEGSLAANSGYLWVSIVYNTSICISLYCLAMFWLCINDDVKPFR